MVMKVKCVFNTHYEVYEVENEEELEILVSSFDKDNCVLEDVIILEEDIEEDITKLVNYLADEDLHFWENCNCSDEVQMSEDFSKCCCEENKNHIYRAVVKVKNWLLKPNGGKKWKKIK